MEAKDLYVNVDYGETTLEQIFDHDEDWTQKEASANVHHSIGEFFKVFDNGKQVITFMLSGATGHEYIWKCIYSDFQTPAS